MKKSSDMPLNEKYKKEVVSAMREKFGYKNSLETPKIQKVSVHASVGRVRDEKEQEEIQKYLALITGQKPAPRAAKQAIASFKTRKGLIIGYQVTLRGKRMYDFLTRFIRVACPRMRDFQGIDERSFDPRGNLTAGVREHIVFPEMIGEDYKLLFGFEVTVVTNARKREEGVLLLKLMGFPIKSET